MKNLIKLSTLIVILLLNSGFYGLNFFQKKTNAPAPFKVTRTLTDGSSPNFLWGQSSSSTHAYFNVNFSMYLWETDATGAGTQSLKSWLSPLPIDARFITEVNGLVYYISDTTGELWRSDNTVGGTFAISAPSSFGGVQGMYSVSFGGQPYTIGFGSTNTYQRTIFQTDGTLAGTYVTILAADLDLATWGMTANGLTLLFSNSTTNNLDLMNYDVTTHTLGAAYKSISGYLYYGFLSDTPKNLDKFYFSVHPFGGCDLMYVTDGTSGGTYNLSSVQYCNITYGGTMPDGSQVFVNTPGFRKWGFYKTKGTSASDWTLITETTLDSTVAGNNWGIDFETNINNKVVVRFFNNQHTDMPVNCPIWVSDGTVSGTIELTNTLAIHPSSDSILSRSHFNPVVFNNNIFFQGYTVATGSGLWKTDGTTAPTAVITGVDFTSEQYYWEYYAKKTPGYFVFNGTSATTGRELYRSDGTPGGSYLLKDINPGVLNAVGLQDQWGAVIGNKVVFAADNTTNGPELWVTDGTSVGTVPLAFLNQNPGASELSDFQIIGSHFFFTARDDSHGVEPWVSDGTSTGTHLLVDTIPGPENSSQVFFADSSSGAIMTSVRSATNDSALWNTDGTTVGTTQYYTSVVNSPLLNVNGTVYFNGNDGASGQQLWKTDGTAGNTALVKDIGGGNSIFDYGILWFEKFNNSVLFAPSRTLPGNPWISDGTSAGTLKLMTIVTGVYDNSYPSGGFAIGTSQFLFKAMNVGYHVSLYTTDGTPGGTSVLKDIFPGGDPQIQFLSGINSKVVFLADDGVNGLELWASDGTVGGTQMIKDISPGGAATYFEGAAVVSDGNYTYFFAQPNGQNWKLWKTDGTTAGTSVIYSFSGTDGPASTNMIEAGGYLFFSACTAANGCELWRSDKTGAGTRLYWDLVSGAGSSDPEGFVYFNNLIFFRGNYLNNTTRAIWATGINSH